MATLIALFSPPKSPRLAYRVQPVKGGGFVIVDGNGDHWSDAPFASESAALKALVALRREREALDLVEDRHGAKGRAQTERLLVARRLVRSRAAAKKIIADVLDA